MIAPAQTNGGRLNSAHKEFSNGYLFAVYVEGDYIPVTFDVYDIFGKKTDALIASGDVFHKNLMRSDGGEFVKGGSTTLTFDYRELCKLSYGFSQSPEGDITERYGYGLYDGKNVALDGFKLHSYQSYRADRPFWDPGKTIQNETGQKDLFGFKQIDQRSCIHDEGLCPDSSKCSEDNWKARVGAEKQSQCYTINMEDD